MNALENQKFYPSKIPVLTAIPAGFFIALFVFSPILSMFAAAGIFLIFILWIILSGGLAVIIYLSLQNTWVELGEDSLTIMRGIILKNRSTFLYSQVQDVKEAQNFWSMILGLKQLRVVTMTGMSAIAGTLPAFRADDADKIKSIIFENIAQAEAQEAKKAGKPVKPQTEEEVLENPYKIHYFYGIALPSFVLGAFAMLSIAGVAIFGLNAIGPVLGLWFYVLIGVVGVVGYIIHLATIRYKISNLKFEIAYGLLSMQKATFNIEKTQDIVISKSIFDSMFGLANFKAETGSTDFVYSGGKSESLLVVDTRLPLLKKADAYALRDFFFETLGLGKKEKSPELIAQYPLDRGKPLKKTVAFLFGWTILLIITGTLFWLYAPSQVAWIIAAGIILVAGFGLLDYIFELLYFRSYYYNSSDDLLFIRKGVINITEIAIPFGKIQNVFVDQDIFDRIFGLYDLHLSTVTPVSGMRSHIDGLSRENAQGLRNYILERMKGK